MQRKIQIHEVLTILELPLNSWKLNKTRISSNQAKLLLIEFKKLVKKQHHVLVKKYHPDIPANGEQEELKMKQINSVVDIVMKLEITIIPRRPQRVTVRFHRTTGFSNSSTTSSNFYSF